MTNRNISIPDEHDLEDLWQSSIMSTSRNKIYLPDVKIQRERSSDIQILIPKYGYIIFNYSKKISKYFYIIEMYVTNL